MDQTQSLRGQVMIVTGGGGSIGAATAQLLASRGAAVIVGDRDLGSAKRVAEQIVEAGDQAFAFQADLQEESQIQSMIRCAVVRYGALHALVNNAAAQSFANDGNIERMDVAVWDQAFAVNARGTMLSCKYALAIMRQHEGGSIVNLASNLALQGHLFQAAYSSSKAAILQMTRSIAASHGRFGVRCNAVSPGLTLRTDGNSPIPAAVRNSVTAETLTGRLAQVEDIAAAIAFLVSNETRHITGQNLVVDGGNSSHVPGFERLLAVDSV